MKTYRSICFLLVAAFGVTASFAQTKPGQKPDTPPTSAVQTTDVDKILKIVTQTQDEVKALETAVASLAANQRDQTAQISVLLRCRAAGLCNLCIDPAANEHDRARRLERECPLLISRNHGGW